MNECVSMLGGSKKYDTYLPIGRALAARRSGRAGRRRRFAISTRNVLGLARLAWFIVGVVVAFCLTQAAFETGHGSADSCGPRRPLRRRVDSGRGSLDARGGWRPR